MFDGFYDFSKRDLGQAQHHDLDVAQWEWEITALMQLVSGLAPKNILELGSWQGGSLFYWLHYALPGSQIISMDTRPALPIWDTWTPDEVQRIHLQGNSHHPTMLACVKQLLAGKMLDFLFIDSDHTEMGVTQDFEMYGPLVKRGGLIAFHDILNPAPSRNQDHVRVSILWKRIQQAGYVTRELIADPAQSWGGIGVVYL